MDGGPKHKPPAASCVCPQLTGTLVWSPLALEGGPGLEPQTSGNKFSAVLDLALSTSISPASMWDAVAGATAIQSKLLEGRPKETGNLSTGEGALERASPQALDEQGTSCNSADMSAPNTSSFRFAHEPMDELMAASAADRPPGVS